MPLARRLPKKGFLTQGGWRRRHRSAKIATFNLSHHRSRGGGERENFGLRFFRSYTHARRGKRAKSQRAKGEKRKRPIGKSGENKRKRREAINLPEQKNEKKGENTRPTYLVSFFSGKPSGLSAVRTYVVPPPESMAAIQSQGMASGEKGGSVRICPRRRRRRKRNCPGQKEEEEEEVVGEVVSLLSPSIFLSSPAPAKK